MVVSGQLGTQDTPSCITMLTPWGAFKNFLKRSGFGCFLLKYLLLF